MNNDIKSPITLGKAKHVAEIDTAPIVAYYKGFDASPFFGGKSTISVYECLDTGYQFFYPYTLAGNGPFYEFLSAWSKLYYIPWKWEHEEAVKHIKKGSNILEIGCANGDFLLEMRKRGATVAGTELNEEAAEAARKKGIDVSAKSLSELARERAGRYDVVCAFQVLEHMSDVRSFISDSLLMLKKDGLLIIGVPNNESFIKDDRAPILNMPPHHMGIWSKTALTKLPSHFGMDVVSINPEPLQKHHYRYYYQVKIGDKLKPFGFIGKVVNKAVFETIGKPVIALRADKVIGHTVVAVFKKK